MDNIIFGVKRVLVWGLGVSGRWALELLKKEGYETLAGDDARGDRWEDYINLVDTVVLSPGIKPRHPLWIEPLRKGIEVIGELELAFRFFKGKVIAVTGTDGKSTTVSMTHLILKESGINAVTCGNIGTPFSKVALENPNSVAVIEVSSFQGKTLKKFRPLIGAFLNFHPDHLDWHPTLEDYLSSKHRIFQNQKEDDLFIAGSLQKEVVNTPTSARKVLAPLTDLPFDPSILKVKGKHNLENAKVSALIASAMGVEMESIKESLSKFRGLPFRMELVGKIRGVEIYNDSKSTTPNSLKSALESFPDSSVILIAGGKNKGTDFSHLKELVAKKVKHAILIGETKHLIKEAWDGSCEISLAEDLPSAVKKAWNIASGGNFILLSPGCSSFDMFESYIHRGQVFNRLVEDIIKSENGGGG